MEKSRRPSDSAFKQQRLKAWQPILTAGTVLPVLFVAGIIAMPTGFLILFIGDNVKEHRIDYTYTCIQDGDQLEHPETKISSQNLTSTTTMATTKTTTNGNNDNRPVRCADKINPADSQKVCKCAPISFNLTEDFEGKVFIYYALTNFHQNHRRYVSSRDDNDLLGLVGTAKHPKMTKKSKGNDDPCWPFRFTEKGKVIVPCGAIANSMFSDDIALTDGKGRDIPLLNRGIAWPSDKEHKFKNPPWFNNRSNNPAWKKYASPIAWRKKLWQLDPANPDNNGLQNEDFIVWMRTAALPNFRKLYRIVDHEKAHPNLKLAKGLLKGQYFLHINYSFPVTSFGGTKSVIIATTSLLGGRNNFLGVAYITVGVISLVLGILLLIIHMNYGTTIHVDIIHKESESTSMTEQHPVDN